MTASSGELRGIRSEARLAERTRIAEMLDQQIVRIDRLNPHPASTDGRRRVVLISVREAIAPILDERMDSEDTSVTAYVGTSGVTDAGEWVDVGVYLLTEEGAPDPYPVRLSVGDVDSNVSRPWLDIDAAEHLILALTMAVDAAKAYAAEQTTDGAS